MAKNGPKDGGRSGTVKGRTQFVNTKTSLYQKRDTQTGRILDVKTSGGEFKSVRREK